ncbi:hypothetical protein PIB30_000022 [Stylosanthes scabra]|uniref:Uncharacterized protein n=1 Tax=Stylosanthes scabra TaxID=79078 RepID=A0ABU6Q1T9_9FABA|nr:hypothetical protein [Stylosanthes scabra]
MESYRNTYAHHINHIPGQALWEKSLYNRPLAPKFKKKSGKLTKKRRKDADKGKCGLKKKNDGDGGNVAKGGSLKRKLKPFTFITNTAKSAATVNLGAPNFTNPPPTAEAAENSPIPNIQAAKIELSQPNYDEAQDSQQAPAAPATRRDNLPTKRRSSPTPFVCFDPMQVARAGTSARSGNIVEFVPTLGFKPPKKKN